MTATTDPASTERRTRLVQLAGELADDFATRAAEHDRDNTFPFENFQRMRETRYLALPIPSSLGGLDADIVDFAHCQERLAQGDGATALAVNMHLFGLGALMERGMPADPASQLMIRAVADNGWLLGGSLTEPESGGNWGFPVTRAEPFPGGIYKVSGRKMFASMAPAMNFFLVNATVPGKDGAPDEVGTFAIPKGTPGLEIIETWDTLGMRATGSHDLRLTDVTVPEAMLIERRPPGNFDERGVALFAWFSTSIAAIYTGIAIAARNFAISYAQNRKPSVLTNSIAHLPGIQFAIADIEIMLATARALTFTVAEEWRAGEHHSAEGMARILQPKYYATTTAIEVVNKAMNVVGGLGIYKTTPLERYYRDVRAGTFHPISQDVSREWIGKAALGIDLIAEPRWG